MRIGSGIAVLVLITSTVLAVAHSGATGVVKERMDLMTSIAEQMKLINEMISGKQGFSSEAVVSAARTIAIHADRIPQSFPDGSAHRPSQALPAVWDDWEGFMAMNTDMKRSAEALAEAAQAEGGSAIADRFAILGQSCIACHEAYRMPN